MQLEHALGATKFAVRIPPYVIKQSLGLITPFMHLNLLLQSIFACHHPVYTLCLHVLLIILIGKLFMQSFLMYLSHPQGYHLKDT